MTLLTSTLSFFLMLISASLLPLLAFFALLLRRNMLQGKAKLVLLSIGTLLLFFAIYNTIHEHGDTVTLQDVLVSTLTAVLTVIILSKFSHGHHHHIEEDGAKGIVISEAFHSLLDGAVIGATYLINPLFGYAATFGIILHELPKMLGTLTLFRGIGFSFKKTITYGIASQIGSPIAALLVYFLGLHFEESNFKLLELASVSSFAAIVLWIIYLEIMFHKKHPGSSHDDHCEHHH